MLCKSFSQVGGTTHLSAVWYHNDATRLTGGLSHPPVQVGGHKVYILLSTPVVRLYLLFHWKQGWGMCSLRSPMLLDYSSHRHWPLAMLAGSDGSWSSSTTREDQSPCLGLKQHSRIWPMLQLDSLGNTFSALSVNVALWIAATPAPKLQEEIKRKGK